MVALAFGIGFLVAALSVTQIVWPSISKIAYFIGYGAAFFAWIITEYAITMTMVDRRISIAGLSRFMGTNIFRFLPLVIGLLQIIIFPQTVRNGSPAAIVLILLLILVGGGLVVLLPAWPIEQSQSSKLVSPWRALKATKGHRVQLLILAGIANGMDRFVPALTAIHDPARVALAVAENTAVNTFSNLITAAVAASAFIFAIKNDPSLG